MKYIIIGLAILFVILLFFIWALLKMASIEDMLREEEEVKRILKKYDEENQNK